VRDGDLLTTAPPPGGSALCTVLLYCTVLLCTTYRRDRFPGFLLCRRDVCRHAAGGHGASEGSACQAAPDTASSCDDNDGSRKMPRSAASSPPASVNCCVSWLTTRSRAARGLPTVPLAGWDVGCGIVAVLEVLGGCCWCSA